MAREAGRPIPVLLLARELGPGGTERQLTELGRSLDRSQFEPHVGCFHTDGFRGEELRQAGVPTVQFPVRSLYKPSTIAAGRLLGDYLGRHRIPLVHSFDTPMNVFGVFAARAYRAPVVISSQRAYRSLARGMSRHLLRLTDRMVDAVVVNCEAMRKHLVEQEKVSPALIRLCYNGVDTRRFQPRPGPRREPLRDASLVIGVVCAMRPEKGLPTLLDAFARVRSLRPGLRLVLVGGGSMLPELESQSRRLGIAAQTLFQPFTGQVEDWLRSVDIFVLPSLSEALSNSLMEAMACGCAVAASRVGGNPELVEDHRTGLLFGAGDAGELAAALRLLIEHETLRKDLAAAGASHVRQSFSLEAAARRMEGIYSALLDGFSTTPGHGL